MALVLAACGTPDGSVLSSRTVAPESSDPVPDPDPEASDRDPDPAPGSSDPDPELSPDPDVEYPADTCYHQTGADPVAEEVPCDRPHTIEVYASIDLPGGPGAPYQGLEAAFEVCGRAFEARTGIGINLATVYERSVLRPSEETWAQGERDVTCYVVYPDTTTERLADIDPVRSFGRVSVFGLDAGDCLAGFDDDASWFRDVGCGEPHEAEVFVAHRFDDGPFPGTDEVDAVADELCFGDPFEDYVGRDYASSSVLSLVSAPTAETWSQGDRLLNCILTDEGSRTGSFRDSAF
jgi:hypothetical protein